MITFCYTGCFVTSPSTADLSHRVPVSAGAYSDSYPDQKDDKDVTLFYHILLLNIYSSTFVDRNMILRIKALHEI